MQDRGTEIIESRHLATEENIVEQFQNVNDQHNSRAESVYFEIFQSWQPSESKLMEPEKYNDMGLEFAKRSYPDHLIQVVTHLDKAHIHNHILISRVNTVTGKSVETTKMEYYRIRKINDTVARENGFSVLQGGPHETEAKLRQE